MKSLRRNNARNLRASLPSIDGRQVDRRRHGVFPAGNLARRGEQASIIYHLADPERVVHGIVSSQYRIGDHQSSGRRQKHPH